MREHVIRDVEGVGGSPRKRGVLLAVPCWGSWLRHGLAGVVPFPFLRTSSTVVIYETTWLHTPNSSLQYWLLRPFQLLVVSMTLHSFRLWEQEDVSRSLGNHACWRRTWSQLQAWWQLCGTHKRELKSFSQFQIPFEGCNPSESEQWDKAESWLDLREQSKGNLKVLEGWISPWKGTPAQLMVDPKCLPKAYLSKAWFQTIWGMARP